MGGHKSGVARRPNPSEQASPRGSRKSGQFRVGTGSLQTAQEERPPESSVDSWTTCSEDYQLFAAGVTRPFARDAVRLVRIELDSRVLDVAAGTGEFALAAARRGAQVLATDFSASMLELLERTRQRRRLQSIQTALMDGQALELGENSFDVAASVFGLVFFPDPDRGLRELYRVLKPGGQTVIATWACPARVELMRLVAEGLMESCVEVPMRETSGPHWTELCEPRRLTDLLLTAGFGCVHVVELAHVWTFERVEVFARAVLRMTPSWLELYRCMNSKQKRDFTAALVKSFRARQGEGPYAVTAHGLLAVGSKPR